MANVLAVLCSDIHLSHAAPVARSAEPSWYDAMARQLQQVRDLAARHDVPVVCAGDIFDKWQSPPELINFAIEHMPKCVAVPGQHDLPNHRLADIRRSAYWTLVEAGVVQDVSEGGVRRVGGFLLHPFAWGVDVVPNPAPTPGMVSLAVVHAYCWMAGASYPGAPDTGHVAAFTAKLRGYDAAVFGDNHKGFLANAGGCRVLNCGGFMRRKRDEVDYAPAVGLLMSDGSITRHYLDTSADMWLAAALEDVPDVSQDAAISDFVQSLESLGSEGLDYKQAIRNVVAQRYNGDSVGKLLLESIGG